MAKVATCAMGEASDPIASSRYIRMLSRPSVTRRMADTNQAGEPAAP